jgi:hypothetical protein
MEFSYSTKSYWQYMGGSPHLDSTIDDEGAKRAGRL